jgi:hypothetical protein
MGCLAVALAHFASFVWAYQAVEYPADVAYAHGILDVRQIAGRVTTACEPRVISYRPFGPHMRSQRTVAMPSYELVNYAYLYPVNCYQAVGPDAGRALMSVPYFMKYTPYQFEGHGPTQRALLQNHPFAFQIIAAY